MNENDKDYYKDKTLIEVKQAALILSNDQLVVISGHIDGEWIKYGITPSVIFKRVHEWREKHSLKDS